MNRSFIAPGTLLRAEFILLFIALMGAVFLSTVTAIMIENRYSNLEKQLSSSCSVEIIAKENIRTVFYDYFYWDRMKEAVEKEDEDNEFLSYFLDHLLFHNSFISGASIVKEEIIIGRSGDEFEYIASLGVPEDRPFKALSSGDGIIV